MEKETVVRGWSGQMRSDSRKDQIVTGFITALYGAGVVAMIVIMAMK